MNIPEEQMNKLEYQVKKADISDQEGGKVGKKKVKYMKDKSVSVYEFNSLPGMKGKKFLRSNK